MKAVYILDAVRTPVGKHRGSLTSVRTDDLAALVIKSLLQRNPSSNENVGEVIFGATNQAGEDNRNVARMALLLAGLPYDVTGMTVNRLCGSGLEAIQCAARLIALGEQDCVIAGGVESMTRAPFVFGKTAEAFDRTPPKVFDTSIGWRFENSKMAERFALDSMGETAENVADRDKVSREDQDAFAVESHRRACLAWDNNVFASEITSVQLPQRKGPPVIFGIDECHRADATMAALAKLQPVFRKGGSVTAGNSSPISDGSSALLLVSEEYVKRHNVTPMARVVTNAVAGVEPRVMGLGPIPAIKKACERAGLKLSEIDTIELNEAFAAQALACMRALELDPAKVNPTGGAIALGHPIGSSGARIVATLVHRMKREGLSKGLASLCIGVGQGIATIVERC